MVEAKQKKIDFFCMRNIFVIGLRRINIFLGGKHLCVYPVPKLARGTVSDSGWSGDEASSFVACRFRAGKGRKEEGISYSLFFLCPKRVLLPLPPHLWKKKEEEEEEEGT